MRLLNVTTMQFELFTHPPPYAILSHRWRPGEVELHDMTRRAVSAQRLAKINSTCSKAKQHGYTHVWIDTCCIDKSNHTEYSEAINSMFKMYMHAAMCYVYMDDVPRADDHHRDSRSYFRRSEWFQRGWTLQELIAPRHIIFYAQDWTRIGTKESLADLIGEVTRIDRRVLIPLRDRGPCDVLQEMNIAVRMSWAAGRRTTKEEDRAYSLMGIFNVHMPVMYGEGGERAFTRLQEEIIKVSHDQTIFAWNGPVPETGLLATSPDLFVDGWKLHRISRQRYEQMFGFTSHDPTYSMTNYGIGIELPLVPLTESIMLAYLAVGDRTVKDRAMCIFLTPQPYRPEGHYVRARYKGGGLALGSTRTQRRMVVRRVFVSNDDYRSRTYA